VVEAILSGLEGASAEKAEDFECVAIADDAALLELGRDGLGPGMGSDLDEGFGGRAEGVVDEVSSQSSGNEGQENDEEQNCPYKLQAWVTSVGIL
jgi:hypothetical protein